MYLKLAAMRCVQQEKNRTIILLVYAHSYFRIGHEFVYKLILEIEEECSFMESLSKLMYYYFIVFYYMLGITYKLSIISKTPPPLLLRII